jgi:UDP-N-acetylmuramate: L-alanyl-gamma-D-glutamyl-meso-diaminopimelate ligase
VHLALSGDHNVRNALAALAVAANEGVSPPHACAALSRFGGVKRRLEKRGEAGGIAVYDDFAHHPTAVAATLAALRALGGTGRLVAVFEPRSYTSRTRLFQADFARAFAAADRVVVAAAHLPGKVPEGQRLSEAELVAGIRAEGTEAAFVPTVDAIVRGLVGELRPGDRVAILSNGGFGGIHDKLLRALEAAVRD